MYSLIRNHKRLSYLVVFVFMLTMVFTPVQSAWADPGTFKDIQGHWAQDTIKAMAEAGIVSGNPDGTFDPEGKITRAQFATIVVKAYQMTGSGKVFTDTASHWGKDYIAAANANGVVSGYSDSKFGPDDPITREQMAVMIVKAARLDPSVAAVNFTDQAKISAWALSAVATAYAHNIIKGMPDGSFAPQDYATRAQAAVVVYAGINTKTPPPVPEENYSLIDKAGTYGPTTGTKTVTGNVTIKTKGVTLQNLVIKGDLIIAQEVGDGNVTLNNIKVEGKTYVRGGGKDSIHINGGQYSEIIVEKTATGQVRIVTVDASGIKVIVAENAKGEEIILNGDFKSVTVNADNVNITTQGQTNIGELKIESGLKDVNIELAPNSTVNEMVLNSKTNVEGQGTIKEASGSKANESSFATPPSTITKPSTGGGGSGGSSTVAVSAISVAPETMTLYAGGATGKITATVAPTNATNKNATWTTSDAKVATVANGVVTPVATGTATITATSAANSSKKASCEVTVEEPIAGTFESTGNVGIAPDTAGDAAGKIYAEYKLVTGEGEDNAQTISLAKDKVEYIKVKVVKVGEGEWKDLTANTDATLWFNVEAATGSRTFEVKTKGEEGTVYIAALDWDEKIKTATWQATGGEGDHEGVTYVEYKLMDGDQVSLKIGEVKLIASKDAEGKWVELDPNTDETLWFNKAKATGNYDFFVVTKDGVMYKATLDWQGGDVYTALAAVNAYLTSEKYIYAKAPEVLESHLTKLGLQVGDESDYAAFDKTATGGKNRKTAVFYDLNNNKPGEGYDLPTLTTYFNDMVATRLVTEASMDLVNNAENIEALNGISFVTMLLERFRLVSYGTHSDIPVADKISTLEGLVDRYNALGEAGKTAVLTKIISIRDSKTDKKFARSQHTTDALDAALTEIETEINARLAITSVTIADNKAYASTAAGEGNTVRVLGYGVGINLDAKNEGKKISDTTSIVVELYNGENLLGQQTFNQAGYDKHGGASTTSGTIDAGGQYKATSWDNSWSAGIADIPNKAVAKVQYTDGIATAVLDLSLSEDQIKIFYAAEAVHALFVDAFAETLVLAANVTEEAINAAKAKVDVVTVKTDQNKAVLGELITQARDLLKTDEGTGQEANIEMMQIAPEDPVVEEPLEIEPEAEAAAEETIERVGE